MSRFSPNVPVQDRSGEILANALMQTFAQIGQRRRQSKLDAEREQEQAEAQSFRDLQLAQQGIKRGAAPMEAAVPVPTMENGRIVGVTSAPERFSQLTDQFYRDNQVVQQQQAQQREATLADALFKARVGQMADPEGYAADLAYKNALAEQARALAEASRTRTETPVKWDTETFRDGVYQVHPISGERRRLGDAPVPATVQRAQMEGENPGQGKPPSEGERRAAALLTVARNAANTLMQANAPSRVEAGMSRLGMNEGLSRSRQSWEQAARQFVTSYLYVVSGATASPQEVDNISAQIVPAPGDKPETVAQKRAAMQAMLDAMEGMGGRAVQQPPASTHAPVQPAPVLPTAANPWRNR